MSRQITVSESTYRLIMKVYSVFRDVFDSVDDFIKACVQEFYYRNSDTVLDEDEEERIDEEIFRLVGSH